MRFVGNTIYLLTGGIVLSLGWLCAALVFWLLVVTRPLAGSCLRLAGLCLWPGGRDVVRAAQVDTYRTYIRTGQRPGRGNPGLSFCAVRCVEMLVWLPVGLVLMAAHFLHAGLMVFPVFTNGLARQNIGLAGIALFPFGARVTPAGQARIARHVERSPRGWQRKRGWMILAQPLTALSAAALILWVPSDNRAHSPSPPLTLTYAFADWGGFPEARGRVFTNTDLTSGRPHAGPPLPSGGNAAASVPPLAADDCSRSQPGSSVRLSRGQSLYGAQPLGSRRVAARYGLLHPTLAGQVANVERWVGYASFWRSKAAAGELCRSAVLKQLAQASAMPVSRKAMAAMAIIERTGKGALHARARSVAPLDLDANLLVISSAKRPTPAITLAEAAAPALTLH